MKDNKDRDKKHDKKLVMDALRSIVDYEDAMGAPLGDRLTDIEGSTGLDSNTIFSICLEIYEEKSYEEFFRYGSYLDLYSNKRYNEWQASLNKKNETTK